MRKSAENIEMTWATDRLTKEELNKEKNLVKSIEEVDQGISNDHGLFESS